MDNLVTPVTVTLAICIGMAVLGGALTGNSLKEWYVGLRKPRWQIPTWAFVGVAIITYIVDGITLYRLLTVVTDLTARLIALTAIIVVMLYNELWNYGFLGRRSTFTGFIGIVAFVAPLTILEVILVAYDSPSASLFAVYVAWVVLYDIPWAYTLWKLNPDVRR